MSKLKSRPPVKPKPDLDAFLSGAEEKMSPRPSSIQNLAYPWEQPGVRADINKPFNLRLSEPYMLKLRYISEHTPDSMQKFCLNLLQDAIDKKIKDLTEQV